MIFHAEFGNLKILYCYSYKTNRMIDIVGRNVFAVLDLGN